MKCRRTNIPGHHPFLRRFHGFTIMEIVIVLGILSFLMGASVYYLYGSGPRKELTENSLALESLAREAQTRAIMTHKAHRIIITNNSYLLLEGGQETRDPKEWVNLVTRKQYSINDPDIKVSIYRWGSLTRFFPNRKTPVVWMFPPDGFVEPITIQLDKGESYIKQTYHPLSASITDEEMVIQ